VSSEVMSLNKSPTQEMSNEQAITKSTSIAMCEESDMTLKKPSNKKASYVSTGKNA